MRVVGRQGEDAIGPRPLRVRRLFHRNLDVAADAGDDGGPPGRGLDRRADDGLVLGDRERVELTRAAGGDDRAEGMGGHRRDVLAQPVGVE